MEYYGRQNFGYNTSHNGQFWRYRMQPNCGPRTPYFIIHVPPPVLRCESTYCGLHKTRNRITGGAKFEEQKWKSASKRLRDRKRLENFIERKSLCAAFPFSDLSDQELTDTFFDGMVSWVDILCEKRSGAEWKIRSLKTENKDLQESVTLLQLDLRDLELKSFRAVQRLILSEEHISDLQTRELQLENERLDLLAHVREGNLNLEALKKNLNTVQDDLLRKQMEHSSLEDAFVELETYADKMVVENSDLQAHVNYLETTLEMQQQQHLPVQYDIHHRPPDLGRRRRNRNRRGAFGHC